MYKTGKSIRRLIMLLMAVIAVTVMTANICYKVKAADGDGIGWSYDEETGTLKIWGSGDMADYSYISYPAPPWKECREDIKTVIISEGVTSIGDLAFYECIRLNSISIPDSVTSIGGSAFWCCSSLNSISIPDSVTSIGGNTFVGCSSLSSISIPDGVTSIGDSTFAECSSLSSISIPDSVTSIDRAAFWCCSSLSSISIPDGVTSIGSNAFANCSSLSSISIPDGVTSIGDCAFVNCSSLSSISIPDGVTSIDAYTFSGCSSLSSISIPDGVTSIDAYAFEDCSSLSSITIPSSVTSIGAYAFKGRSKNLTIYGERNSYAHTYAKNQRIRFEPFPKITDAGLFMAENTREHILIGVVASASTSGQTDIEYRWSAKDSSGTTKVIKDWTLNDEWLDWTPDSFGEYTLIAEARAAINPSSSQKVEEVVYFNPYIKGKCQVPYAMVESGQSGYLIGVETYENPNQSYQYEMLILDCSLLAEGKDAWVYTTGKFTVEYGAAGWCVWQPQYGYYWTLFRVYDAQGNMIDQACYPFVNAY